MVSGNKKIFKKSQINGAEKEKDVYTKIGYLSVKEFRRIFQSQRIVDCPMAVQDIYIAHSIWGKKIADLKGNTTRNKTIHMAGDLVKVPRELIKIHKDVFMIANILFVNGTPLFISLI